jgi:DNA-directed RNA polymerase subunit M/transcription elongation factor TFIIS
MVSKQHCPACGFLMMIEIKDGSTTYRCVNNEHLTIGKNSYEINMSQDLIEEYKALSNNVDLLLEYLKRP